jgi:transposase-like protein
MASALATLMNHAMQIEREQVLKAESHQRTGDRQGYANGFKPKTLKTRVGQIALRIPQTRGYRDEHVDAIAAALAPLKLGWFA